MRALALLCAVSTLGVAGAAAAVVQGAFGAEGASARPAGHDPLIASIDRYRTLTWHWQRALGLSATASADSAARSPDRSYRRWVLALWIRRAHRVERLAAASLPRRIAADQALVEHWRQVMGVAAGPLRTTASAGGGLAALEQQAALWRQRAATTLRLAQHPPYASQLLCIHRYEGSWTDGGGPYYGGLQMDLGFQQAYGAYLLRTKGTADHWTPLEQLWVAGRAARSGRGFSPWPNTARICGLL